MRYILLGATCLLAVACGAGGNTDEPVGSLSAAVNPGQCNRTEPKDVLIVDLMKHSWIANYPLTLLSVDASGAIVGSGAPALVLGDLEVINTVPEARDAVARALSKLVGQPAYAIAAIGPDAPACTSVPAWTPSGSTLVNTLENIVTPAGDPTVWEKVHKEFAKVCPLIKKVANNDAIDPPGDGSTNMPPSQTVSVAGVTANAFGYCPAGTPVGTYCKLSYAGGVNYSGRSCQLYYGIARCLLY